MNRANYSPPFSFVLLFGLGWVGISFSFFPCYFIAPLDVLDSFYSLLFVWFFYLDSLFWVFVTLLKPSFVPCFDTFPLSQLPTNRFHNSSFFRAIVFLVGARSVSISLLLPNGFCVMGRVFFPMLLVRCNMDLIFTLFPVLKIDVSLPTVEWFSCFPFFFNFLYFLPLVFHFLTLSFTP